MLARGRCGRCRMDDVPLVTVPVHTVIRWFCPICALEEKR